MVERTIEALLLESRRFPPSERFRSAAHVTDERIYADAEGDPDGFWARAAEELHWFRRWDRVLEWQLPYAQWFVGGRTNLAFNCLDRHLGTARRTKPAIVWEGEPGDERVTTLNCNRDDRERRRTRGPRNGRRIDSRRPRVRPGRLLQQWWAAFVFASFRREEERWQ